MNRLQKMHYFYQFWLNCYYRTFNQCAFKQMLRYHQQLAELYGLVQSIDTQQPLSTAGNTVNGGKPQW